MDMKENSLLCAKCMTPRHCCFKVKPRSPASWKPLCAFQALLFEEVICWTSVILPRKLSAGKLKPDSLPPTPASNYGATNSAQLPEEDTTRSPSSSGPSAWFTPSSAEMSYSVFHTWFCSRCSKVEVWQNVLPASKRKTRMLPPPELLHVCEEGAKLEPNCIKSDYAFQFHFEHEQHVKWGVGGNGWLHIVLWFAFYELWWRLPPVLWFCVQTERSPEPGVPA